MAECEPMDLKCLSASSAPTPVVPADGDGGDERACKRRRLACTPDEGNTAGTETIDLVHVLDAAARVEEHKEASHVEQSEHQLLPMLDVVDAGPASATTFTAAAAATAPAASTTTVPIIAQDPAQVSLSPLGLTPKRTYKCRMGCSAELASSSNRLRHERSKHPAEQVSSRVEVGTDEPPATAYMQRHRFAPRATAPVTARAASSTLSAPTLDELDREDEDVELQQFAAAAAASASRDRCAYRRSPATTTSEEEEEKSEAPSTHADTSSNSSASSPASHSDGGGEEEIPGMRPLFTDADMQEGCLAFLQWLAMPPITQVESLVKSRKGRLATHEQLRPLKNNIRFIFTTLQERELVHTVDLEAFTRLKVCRGLFDALSDRGVGAVRFHALFLLVKKVLVWLSSRESIARRQFIPPSVHESFCFVESVVSDAGLRRRQEGRNRVLLGVETTKQLMQGKYGLQVPQPFSIPTSWSSSSDARASQGSSAQTRSPPKRMATRTAGNYADEDAQQQPTEQGSANEMSPAELQQVAKYCLASLRELMANTTHLEPSVQATRDRWFQANLIVAFLSYGLAPRCQVLRQLAVGSSFRKHADGLWWVQLLSEQSKNSKPVLLALPDMLTSFIDHLIHEVRPRLLAPACADAPATHDSVFVNKNGSPRTDFSACTTLVSAAAGVGPKNAHSFRAGVVTLMFESNASEGELHVLANLMSHDVSTAARSYHRPQYSRAAVLTNSKVANLLLQNA